MVRTSELTQSSYSPYFSLHVAAKSPKVDIEGIISTMLAGEEVLSNELVGFTISDGQYPSHVARTVRTHTIIRLDNFSKVDATLVFGPKELSDFGEYAANSTGDGAPLGIF
jgi:hypothetical protein